MVRSLFRRALGYDHDDVVVTSYQGDITLTPVVRHYQPDTTACIFWLKNRRPQDWRDAQQLEHSGLEGLVNSLRASDEQMARDRAEAARFQSGHESDAGGGGDA